MSDAKVAQIDAPAEPKTPAEWKQQIEKYDLTLAGPPLEPAIRTAIEKLREHAVKMTFLSDLTADARRVTAPVDEPAQQFVTPKVPDVMPVAVAENLKMADSDIAQVEAFLKNAPLPSLIPGAKTLLDERKSRRARILHDFQNPTPIPVPPPPPPIQLPPEVIELVQSIVRAEGPGIVAQTIAWFRANPEWMQSN